MPKNNGIPEGRLVTLNIHEKYLTLLVIAVADQYAHYSRVIKNPSSHPSIVGQAEELMNGFKHCMQVLDTENEGLIKELDTIDKNSEIEFMRLYHQNVIDLDKKRKEKNE